MSRAACSWLPRRPLPGLDTIQPSERRSARPCCAPCLKLPAPRAGPLRPAAQPGPGRRAAGLAHQPERCRFRCGNTALPATCSSPCSQASPPQETNCGSCSPSCGARRGGTARTQRRRSRRSEMRWSTTPSTGVLRCIGLRCAEQKCRELPWRALRPRRQGSLGWWHQRPESGCAFFLCPLVPNAAPRAPIRPRWKLCFSCTRGWRSSASSAWQQVGDVSRRVYVLHCLRCLLLDGSAERTHPLP